LILLIEYLKREDVLSKNKCVKRIVIWAREYKTVHLKACSTASLLIRQANPLSVFNSYL